VKPLSALLAVALAAAVTACGSDSTNAAPPPQPPATLSADALSDLDSTARTLDAAALAADALDPDELERVLDEGGFATGREREFTGVTDTFDHVVARTLVFADAAGAEAYLDWLGRHGEDFLGRVNAAGVVPPGESGVSFVLVPCGICKKELPTYLAGWRRGDTVFSLLAAGSGANRQTFLALARQLDDTVR
jgi:hypothetical protein